MPEIIKSGYEITRSQGRVILVGVPRNGIETSIYTLPLHFGKVLTGSHGGEAVPQNDIPRYMRLYQQGKISLNKLNTNSYGAG